MHPESRSGRHLQAARHAYSTWMGSVGELLARFLADHGDRTREAYTQDVRDFARFVGCEPADAVARLLGHGPHVGAQLARDYAVDLRWRGLAPATMERRLATLRALVRDAGRAGVVDWRLETPSEAEIAVAMERPGVPEEVPYIMPRAPSEIDRLDLQHYALRQALGGNHLAPVRRPARVLDVGAGTGQWAFDLCEQFADAAVVGFDLVPSKPAGPRTYRCVRGNLLQGLPFVDGAFDFVHQRAMLVAIPVADWKAVVAELARVTGPGGWVELVENVPATDPTGPAMQALTTFFRQVASARGLDSTGVVYAGLDRWLREAGVEDVVRREIAVPIGEWAGPVGSLLATDLRNALQQILGLLVRQGRFTDGESKDLLIAIQREWEELRPTVPMAVAYGRKR